MSQIIRCGNTNIPDGVILVRWIHSNKNHFYRVESNTKLINLITGSIHIYSSHWRADHSLADIIVYFDYDLPQLIVDNPEVFIR